VHNGIIENYQELRELLERRGHRFLSETDTEVVTHLLEKTHAGNRRLKTEQLLLRVLPVLRGTYALAVLSKSEPGKVVVARHFSPLLLGVGKSGYFAASDAAAVLPHTKKVVYLDDDEVAVLAKSGIKIVNAKTQRGVRRSPDTLGWGVAEAQKSGFPHFMLKEITEVPQAMENAMRGRNIVQRGVVKLGGIEKFQDRLKKIEKLYIVGCGSAHAAGRYGEYLIESLAGLDVETDLASEFRYRDPILDSQKHAVLVISQSGETADTLAAVDLAKSKGVLTLGIINVVGSSIPRHTDAGIYQYAGPEIGVATTKAFSSQLVVEAMLAVWLASLRQRISPMDAKELLSELASLPRKAEKIIEERGAVAKIAKKYSKFSDFFVLGRKYNAPIASEGAIKIKEITYAHAEGYSAGEMKHGPIAMVDKNFATIGIAPQDSVYEKMASNLQEIKARGGPVVAIATEGDKRLAKIVDDVIYIPKVREEFQPMFTVIPLQLLSYYMGVAKNLDVDKPRNLAKSVTVE
ncbi:MAG: glutamine--fructose-6-phosphate transaminase (isomerizing), partial [Parcubacteria group bacterium]|nr:glutamine--fructose-6-phosphate transaminase (isomerizing) [Parcubacteria group bacterium]